jgi:hypothetical protein
MFGCFGSFKIDQIPELQNILKLPKHPNIVEYYAVFSQKCRTGFKNSTLLYIQMELCPKSLRSDII